MRYYIASRLENAAQVRELKAELDKAGWEHTYDWTVHGSVQREGVDRIVEVAQLEAEGVLTADVIITLLPGGRGTHTEIGIAIGQLQLAKLLEDAGVLERVKRRIILYTEDDERDFGTNGTTCAFYHHPFVEHVTSWEALLATLLNR